MKPHHDIHSPMRSDSGHRAFSLIEVMVAVSLLSFIIVGLLAMFFQVQRAFRAGTAQADIMEGGRATMGLLVRDLQEMTACRLTNIANCVIRPSTRIDGTPLDATVNPTYQDIPTGSQRTNWFQDLTFMSRVNDKWMATSYRVVFGENGVGALYRLMEEANRMTLFDQNSNTVWNLNLLSTVPYGATVPFYGAVSNYYHRLLDGIVSFDVRVFDTNGLAFTRTNLASAAANPNTWVNPSIRVDIDGRFFGFSNGELPAYVDIELAILEPSTLAKFRGREDISQDQALEYLQRQIGRTHVFRQRVAIRPSATQVSSVH